MGRNGTLSDHFENNVLILRDIPEVMWSRSVMSDSLRTHGLYPTRFLCPWDFPGKNTGVGCHFLLQEIFPTQGLNLGLPHSRQMLYRLSHLAGSILSGNVCSYCRCFGSYSKRIWKKTQNFTFKHCSYLCFYCWSDDGLVCVCVCVCVAESGLTVWDLMDCSWPCFSVLGILQAGILEWAAIFFSRGSSWYRDDGLIDKKVGRIKKYVSWTLNHRVL